MLAGIPRGYLDWLASNDHRRTTSAR